MLKSPLKSPGGRVTQTIGNPELTAKLRAKSPKKSSPAATLFDDDVYQPEIPKHLVRKVEALKKIQFDQLAVETQYFLELCELDVKYEKMFAPFYDKRHQIISGAVEPAENTPEGEDADMADCAKRGKVHFADDETEDIEDSVTDVKGIPSFWLTALKNALEEDIEEYDEPILHHLVDIRVKSEVNPMGFMLEFHFEPNEHFTNSVLTKYYEMKCAPDSKDPFSFDGPEIVRCKGCTINWNKGKNITTKIVQWRQKRKSLKAARLRKKVVQRPSFFNFFSPPTVPGDEEELVHELRCALAADYRMGGVIKDCVIPQAVLYFTGETMLVFESDEEDW